MKGDDHALLRAWVGLVRRAYAVHPEYVAGPAATARHRGAVADFICRARYTGEVRSRWRGDALDAVVAVYAEPDSWYGVPRRSIVLDRDPDVADTIGWLRDQVVDLGITADTDIFVFAADRALVGPLLDACPTLGVDSVILLGDPRRALDALMARKAPPTLAERGLTTGPVADVAEVDRLVDLTRDVFAAHPEWCWFGTTPMQLARERSGLLLGIGGREDDLTVVIRRDGVAVGMVQQHLEDNPLWGRTAGVGLLLHPDMWGQGLLNAMYRHMLERLVTTDAVVFKGGTSQPPVMHLGRLMGRPLHAIHLRAGAPMPPAHFASYLDGA